MPESARPRRFQVNPTVFFGSAAVILGFVVLSVVATDQMARAFDAVLGFIVGTLGWFYIVSVAFFLLFVVWLAFSRYGSIKLGKDDDEPAYSVPTWFAMLFSAGMGIGLLFWSVAEPMYHLQSPPAGASGSMALEQAQELRVQADAAAAAGDTAASARLGDQADAAQALAHDAAREAMTLTYFHWGLHAWAIYIVVGLSLAYFAYRHDLPLVIRSTLYPLLGERIYGPIGNLVEVLAVVGTMFGVATSLGLGVMQINAGLDYLGVLGSGTGAQLLLIAVITLLATVSVVSGLDIGIRRLSEGNLVLGLVLLTAVLVFGPTLLLLGNFVESLGGYAKSVVPMTFRTDAYSGSQWQQAWTMFYWGWWISWSPFVGMFIARISRGRTIREFIVGVLLAPALFTFIWLTVFGGTGLHQELTGTHTISQAMAADTAPNGADVALFAMLAGLPWPAITSTLAVVVIATYFITSSDSASLVIDILTADGHPDPPVPQRVFWALTEGAVAAALLWAGGDAALKALQTVSVSAGLPLCVILLLMCWSLVRGLRAERVYAARLPRLPGAGALEPGPLAEAESPGPDEADATQADWQQRLSVMLQKTPPKPQDSEDSPAGHVARRQLAEFIRGTVRPAFEDIAKDLRTHQRTAQIDLHPYHATLTVMRGDDEEFSYTIRGRVYYPPSFTLTATTGANNDRSRPTPRAEVVVRGSYKRGYPLARWSRTGLVHDFLHEYAKWMGW